jgi:hypothetical protein
MNSKLVLLKSQIVGWNDAPSPASRHSTIAKNAKRCPFASAR